MRSHLVLRLWFLLGRVVLLLLPLLRPARPAVSSVRRPHDPAGVAVVRPAMGPTERRRSVRGVGILPLVLLLAVGRVLIGRPPSLRRMPEPRPLLPELDVRLEVLLAIFAPLASSWTFGLDGAVVRASGALSLRCGRRSPSPSGVADDDRSSAFDTVDFDRDDSFRSVLALIRNFHCMEEPAVIPSARCKTSLASIYGLMSETSPAFHLPTSPLVRSLLDDTNLALSKFLEDQTVHGFLPVPGRRHRRYYRTSSSSFPGPYSVPPGVTSITLEKASEARKRSVSLSASQVSSLETTLSGVCEVSSWLDWWLSKCGGFREHLPDEGRADFERLILSGSRALEFLASQGCTALGNLVLSRRDSLLADVCFTVPSEEVARLRYSPLPETVALFPSALLDSALTKMRAAANDDLVQRTLHPPRIPRTPAAAGGSAQSSVSGSRQASSSGACPAQKQMSSSSPSGQSGKKRKNRKDKAPFSSSSGGSGCSGGKGIGAGKKSA